ncbi:hypothetical protein BGZ65_012391, partial [Modicella reniformis]
PNPAAKDQRGDGACGVSNDYFIAWGGLNGDWYANTTAVYNIKTNLWTSAYEAALAPTTTIGISTTSSPTSSGSPDSTNSAGKSQGNSLGESSGNSPRVMIIVAGVLGVVVALLA